MASLDHDLDSGELHSTTKRTIVDAFWGPSSRHQFATITSGSLQGFFDPYFRFYAQQCDLIGLHANGDYSSAKTHRDVVELAKILRQNLTRDEVRQRLHAMVGDASREQHEHSINLVSRLLVMVQFGEVAHEWSGSRPLHWADGSLAGFLRLHFSPVPALGHERVKFEKTFNALALGRISGIEVRWTSNLADHLRLTNDDTVLCVFHHVSFLRQQHDNAIFPGGFIEETLQTIALLMPKYDKRITAWYFQLSKEKQLDPCVVETGHLIADERQVENFRYWHDRLVVLKQVFDESRPVTLSQWWYDRRNGVQWYTFWVAIVVLVLTIFFGLIQSVEGALQVYVAFTSS